MAKIIQYKNGIPLRKYKSIAEIQKKKGYLKSHISECLNNKRAKAYGYEWKYETRRKGRLRYWFRNKNAIIKDVGHLCDRCEQYEKEIEILKAKIEMYKKLGISIDIYGEYKVTFLNSGAYISQEDSTPDDIVFNNYENSEEKIIDGSKLLDIIKRELNDRYLQGFSIIDNTIRIETFNYYNGENNKYIMIIEKHLESKGE